MKKTILSILASLFMLNNYSFVYATQNETVINSITTDNVFMAKIIFSLLFSVFVAYGVHRFYKKLAAMPRRERLRKLAPMQPYFAAMNSINSMNLNNIIHRNAMNMTLYRSFY